MLFKVKIVYSYFLISLFKQNRLTSVDSYVLWWVYIYLCCGNIYVVVGPTIQVYDQLDVYWDISWHGDQYSTHLCSDDQYSVAAQQTWKASSRGACLISRIEAELFPVDSAHDYMTCAPYTSTPGTSYGTFFIIMDGDDACCVLSSHQKPQQCSSDTKSHSRIHMLA